MKRTLLIFAIALQGIAASSQTVNGIEISGIQSEYMEIIAVQKMLSNKVNVSLQFGQEDKLFKMKDTQLIGKDGRLVVFNSVTDALNFFNEVGYYFVDRVVVTGSYGMYYSILLRRTK